MKAPVATWCGNETVQELRQREDGSYYKVTYIREPDYDRDVTLREADEFVDDARRHGGTVHREIGRSLRVRP